MTNLQRDLIISNTAQDRLSQKEVSEYPGEATKAKKQYREAWRLYRVYKRWSRRYCASISGREFADVNLAFNAFLAHPMGRIVLNQANAGTQE